MVCLVVKVAFAVDSEVDEAGLVDINVVVIGLASPSPSLAMIGAVVPEFPAPPPRFRLCFVG